jgi:hypothetical protein
VFRRKRFLLSYILAAAMVSGFVLEVVGLASWQAQRSLRARLPGEFPQPPPWTGPARPFIPLKDTTPKVAGEPAAPPPSWTLEPWELDNTPKEKTGKEKAAERLAGAADLTLTADELGKEQKNDVEATKKKYKGKVIELTGSVRGINRSLNLHPILTLRVKGESVQLSIWMIEGKPWEKVLPGQGVKLNVIYGPQPGRGDLVGGPIREVTGTPNPSITAEELVKAYEADEAAAEKKFGSSNSDALLVTGEIVEATPYGPAGVPEFVLKTGSKVEVSCQPDRESARRLEHGMKVKLIGKCSGFDSRFGKPKEVVRLVDCLVLEATNRLSHKWSD